MWLFGRTPSINPVPIFSLPMCIQFRFGLVLVLVKMICIVDNQRVLSSVIWDRVSRNALNDDLWLFMLFYYSHMIIYLHHAKVCFKHLLFSPSAYIQLIRMNQPFQTNQFSCICAVPFVLFWYLHLCDRNLMHFFRAQTKNVRLS